MGASRQSTMEREGALVQSVYYGRIGSEVTERLLERFGHDGSFLLRDSDTVQGAYCLCVRKAPYVHTYRLIHTEAGWSLQGSEVRLPSCETLGALIQSFRSGLASVAGLVPVMDPLDKSPQHDLSSGPEFVYTEICNSSSWAS